jgi:hypothetical protein
MRMTNKKTIESVLELTEDLATTHKSFRSDAANTPEALKDMVARDFEAVMKNGYVIIEDLLTASQHL